MVAAFSSCVHYLIELPQSFFLRVHFRILTPAYYPVYFELNEAVSIVISSIVSKVELEVGGFCFVRVKGKLCKGSIVTNGEKLRVGVLKLSILGLLEGEW